MRLITKKLPPKDEPGSIKMVAEEGEGGGERVSCRLSFLSYC